MSRTIQRLDQPAIFPPIRKSACEIFLRDMVARVAIRLTMRKPSAEQVDGLKPTRKMDMRFAVTGRVCAAKRRCNSASSFDGEHHTAYKSPNVVVLHGMFSRTTG